jgi:hypothetical protein
LPAKKPSQVGEIQRTPKRKSDQILVAAGGHHGKEAPKGKSGQAQPKQNPVQGEEAEKAQRGGRHKAADFGGIDGVEIKILDLGSDQSAFTECLVQLRL